MSVSGTDKRYIVLLASRVLRPDCQMVLFSATYNEDVMRFAQISE